MTSAKSTTHQLLDPLGPIDPNVFRLMDEVRSVLTQVQLLNERYTNNDRRLVESEDRNSEALKRLELQVTRVHERLDELKVETAVQISEAISPLVAKSDSLDVAIKGVRSDLDSWINRGKGAWFIASIAAGIFQCFIVAALAWALTEIKTLHDWRITIDAQRTEERRQK